MNGRMMRMALASTMEPGDPRVMTGDDQQLEGTWKKAFDGGFGPRIQQRARAWSWEEAQQATTRAGARFVVPGDEGWPTGLWDLDNTAPLHGRQGTPTGVWWKGAAPPQQPSVAVVGARAASAYGVTAAAELSAGLAQLGFSVVSGGAHGIDAAAHRGALAAGGFTVLVTACGVDVPYPRGNAALHTVVSQRGAVVSEYPPGTTPIKPRFLARNRIIAAWGVGVVLVEAAARSGARNTMHWADSLSRVSMAVPGTIASGMSVLPHRLIRDHQATLVTSAEEIASMCDAIGAWQLVEPEGESRLGDTVDGVTRQVLEVLPWHRGAGAQEISALADLDSSVVLSCLETLSQRGVATCEGGVWRLRIRGNTRVAGPQRGRLHNPTDAGRGDTGVG